MEKNDAIASAGLLREHSTIVAGYDKERLVLIDAAEQLNFLPVQDRVRIDSFAARSIEPNSGALSKMRCGDMDLNGVVVRILAYRKLYFPWADTIEHRKGIGRTKGIFIDCEIRRNFRQDFAALKALTCD